MSLYSIYCNLSKKSAKEISAEEKLNVINQTETVERIVDICHNVSLAQSSVRTICDNADRIKETAMSGTKEFVCASRLPQSYWNEPYHNYGCEFLTFLLHYK